MKTNWKGLMEEKPNACTTKRFKVIASNDGKTFRFSNGRVPSFDSQQEVEAFCSQATRLGFIVERIIDTEMQ